MSIIRIYVSNNVPGVEFVSWGPNETLCQCEPLWSGLGNILQLHAIFFCIVLLIVSSITLFTAHILLLP